MHMGHTWHSYVPVLTVLVIITFSYRLILIRDILQVTIHILDNTGNSTLVLLQFPIDVHESQCLLIYCILTVCFHLVLKPVVQSSSMKLKLKVKLK